MDDNVSITTDVELKDHETKQNRYITSIEAVDLINQDYLAKSATGIFKMKSIAKCVKPEDDEILI